MEASLLGPLQETYGRAHFNAYLSRKDAPDERTANRRASQWKADCDAEIQYVGSLPEIDRKAFVAAGGLEGARKRSEALARRLEVHKPVDWLIAPVDPNTPIAPVIQRHEPAYGPADIQMGRRGVGRLQRC
jgi:hypothetical protein